MHTDHSYFYSSLGLWGDVRPMFLENLGLRVWRFTNDDVNQHFGHVIQQIDAVLIEMRNKDAVSNVK